MKDLYIPRGKILRYESLTCRNIVNDGALIVEKGIQARHISGKGVLNVGSISCRAVSAMDIEAGTITTRTLAAERVCAAEVKASGAVAVSCCLESGYVETPRLTVAVCQVETVRADQVIYLTARKRSIIGALFAGFVRRLWMMLKARVPVDAEYEPVQKDSEGAEAEHQASEPKAAGADPNAELLNDFEFKRLAAMYRLLKPYGFTVRLVSLQEQKKPVNSVFQDAA